MDPSVRRNDLDSAVRVLAADGAVLPIVDNVRAASFSPPAVRKAAPLGDPAHVDYQSPIVDRVVRLRRFEGYYLSHTHELQS
jgi:hypothetical protein